jgi:heterodisulfide reductase subunit D
VSHITEIKKNGIESYSERTIKKPQEFELRTLLKHCYQCGRCSGVCQLSKVQKYPPSKIIQLILEGFEEKVLESGTLWDCLTCNSCLQNCPQDINFADLVRLARFKMINLKNQNPDEYIAHKGMYTTISEIMSQQDTIPNRDLGWIPEGCEISDTGSTLYYVGCLPFFNFEFEDIDPIAISTLKIICQVESAPVVVLREEICCGHDIYWGQGKLDEFDILAHKNISAFKKAGIKTIVTACAECYRTFKVDYADKFEEFRDQFEVKHIIEYVYDNWKKNKLRFQTPGVRNEIIPFTFHDPCRLSRFLPKENDILEKTREIFGEFKKLGYEFKEMDHNKKNSLCCGVSAWMNCNEKSKALRYKRMLEAKEAGSILVTSCPKCRIHLKCLQNDFEDIASIEILDFSEFVVDHIEPIDNNEESEASE